MNFVYSPKVNDGYFYALTDDFGLEAQRYLKFVCFKANCVGYLEIFYCVDNQLFVQF